MVASLRRGTAMLVVLSLLMLVPVSASGPRHARLEGLLVDLDGQPARGFRVLLIDERGGAIGAATTSERGLYSFAEVAPGLYGLGIESPTGAAAPVFAPPVRLDEGELARRDIRLMQASAEQLDQGLEANYTGIRIWWAGRSKREKAVWLTGLVVGVALIWYLLDDDDERRSSEVVPPVGR